MHMKIQASYASLQVNIEQRGLRAHQRRGKPTRRTLLKLQRPWNRAGKTLKCLHDQKVNHTKYMPLVNFLEVDLLKEQANCLSLFLRCLFLQTNMNTA